MNFDTFISHSSKDKPIADAICQSLEASGVMCWIAPRNIIGGEKWEQAIKRGIEQSSSMVLVLTSSSNASNEVLKEIVLAVEARIPIIPFRVDNISPSDSLGSYISAQQWLDAFNPPLEKHIDELSDSLCRLLHITKRTGISTRASELFVTEDWIFYDLVPDGEKGSATVDAVSVVGTTWMTEKGILVIYHLDGIYPSKTAFLNLGRKENRIRWVYSSPVGQAITRIAWSGSFLFVEQMVPRSGGDPQRILVDLKTGVEVPTFEHIDLGELGWRKIRDFHPLRGDSTSIHVDGRILEMATQKAPFVRIRWISPDSDIDIVSPVSYPLMGSYVMIACHDLSLHCLLVSADHAELHPELNWYAIERHAVEGYGLLVKCNGCNAITEYNPRDGENPGSKCPACGQREPIFSLYGW
jgi:hypothetical protein